MRSRFSSVALHCVVWMLVLAMVISGVQAASLTDSTPAIEPTTKPTLGATQATQNGTLTGTVTAPNGDTIAGVHVIAVRRSSNVYRLVRAEPTDLLTHTQTPPVDVYRTLLARPHPPDVYVTTTGTNGRYSLDLPAGRYAIRALDNTSSPPIPGPGVNTAAPTAMIQSASTTDVDIELGDILISRCFCPTLSLGSTTGEEGETVTVTISTTAKTTDASRTGANVSGYDLNVTFDPQVGRVTGVSAVDMAAPDQLTINNAEGWVHLVNQNEQPVAAPTIAKLQFEITTNSSTATHLLFTNDSAIYGPNGDRIDVQTSLEGRIESIGETSIGARYDTDNSGQLSLGELQVAIADWQADTISNTDITILVQMWAEQQSV